MKSARDTTDLLVAVCREVDKETGQVAVCKVDSETIFCLRLRGRCNPELRYFVALRELWDDPEWQKQVMGHLKRRLFRVRLIEETRGIAELN